MYDIGNAAMTGSKMVLMLSDNVSNDYVSRIAKGAEKSARALSFGFKSINIHSGGGNVADLIADENVAAVILTPPLSDDRQVLGQLEAKRLPMIRIAAMLDLERGCTVVMDEYDAARAVTTLMLEKGHRKVGFIKGPRAHLTSMRRQNGFANALGGKGLRLDPALSVQGDFSRQSGRDLAPKLFAQKPTAIFASNDEMALGVMDAAVKAGLEIPRDLSVVGFDDNEAAKSARPPLTTVRQPLGEMGEMACKLAVERAQNPSKAPAHEQVPYEVMDRDSVGEVGG